MLRLKRLYPAILARRLGSQHLYRRKNILKFESIMLAKYCALRKMALQDEKILVHKRVRMASKNLWQVNQMVLF